MLAISGCETGPFIHFKFRSQKGGRSNRLSTHGSTQMLGIEIRQRICTIMGLGNARDPRVVGHIHLHYSESFRKDEQIKDSDLVLANSYIIAKRSPLPWDSKTSYKILVGATPANKHSPLIPFVPTIPFPSIYRPVVEPLETTLTIVSPTSISSVDMSHLVTQELALAIQQYYEDNMMD